MKGPRAAHTYSDTKHDVTKQPFSNLTLDGCDSLLKPLFGTIEHFLGNITAVFSEMAARRAPKRITCSLPALAFVGV